MKCHELDVIVENTSAHHLIAKVKDIFLAVSDFNEKNGNEKKIDHEMQTWYFYLFITNCE